MLVLLFQLIKYFIGVFKVSEMKVILKDQNDFVIIFFRIKEYKIKMKKIFI